MNKCKAYFKDLEKSEKAEQLWQKLLNSLNIFYTFF